MFLNGSRLRGGGVAFALLLSLVAGSTSLSHTETLGSAGSVLPVAHDARAHYIGSTAAPEPTDADSCFLCHSLRSFYPAFDKFEHHHDAPRIEPLHFGTIHRASAVAWTLVPGRAPPA